MDANRLLRLRLSIRSAIDTVPAGGGSMGATAMVNAYRRTRAEARDAIPGERLDEFERLFPEEVDRPTSTPAGRLGLEASKFNSARALLEGMSGWLEGLLTETTVPAPPALDQLHPLVQQASQSLSLSGHHAQAVFEACKAVEARVQALSGLDSSGRDLMTKAFTGEPEPIDLRHEPGRSGEDEQEGFRFLFMGAMQGIRNPKGHGLIRSEDPIRAFEYLSFLSLLMRRLDDASEAAKPEQ